MVHVMYAVLMLDT